MKVLCPTLPPPRTGLDWRFLNVHRKTKRGSEFYKDCLEYGNFLWNSDQTARAILCLDRAFGADVSENDPVLLQWPLPYAALGWMLKYVPKEEFIGNPRVHFQHYADRLLEPRREVRRARGWACWALVRKLNPNFIADPKHVVVEPTEKEITGLLNQHGHVGEAVLWQNVLATI
ncbi:MAG: hypothetical protein WCO38_01605 [Verrucomicrobiota bacterium]|jgi:hypothetical protein